MVAMHCRTFGGPGTKHFTRCRHWRLAVGYLISGDYEFQQPNIFVADVMRRYLYSKRSFLLLFASVNVISLSVGFVLDSHYKSVGGVL